MWKLTIRRKLLAGFSAVLVVLVLTVVTVYHEFIILQQRYTTIADREVPNLVATQELRVIIRDIRGSARSYLLNRDEASKTNFYQSHYYYERTSKQLLNLMNDEDEKMLLRQLDNLEQQLYRFGEEIMTKEQLTDDSVTIASTKLSDLAKQVEAVSNQLAEAQKKDVSAMSRSLSTEIRAFKTLLIVLGVAGGDGWHPHFVCP